MRLVIVVAMFICVGVISGVGEVAPVSTVASARAAIEKTKTEKKEKAKSDCSAAAAKVKDADVRKALETIVAALDAAQ